MAVNTFRTILNNVLTNIGETTVPAASAALSDTYQLQVANFINKFKEEVENAGRWRAHWLTMNIAYLANVNTQQIKDSVSGAYATSRSKLVRMMDPRMGRELGLVFDITSFGIPFPLYEVPMATLIYQNTLLNQGVLQYSTHYAIQDSGNDTVNLLVYPGAGTPRTIQITMCVPQTRIDATVSGSSVYPWLGSCGLDTPIMVPAEPIEIGASWYALKERGEELGTDSLFTEERFRVALDDAVSRDIGEQGDLQMVLS